MPDGGEGRITGFIATGPDSLSAQLGLTGGKERTLAAHKDAGEESRAGRLTETKRGGRGVDRADGGRTEAGKCRQRNDSAHEWECRNKNRSEREVWETDQA